MYGRPGDLEALRDELAVSPQHTLLLWPGDGALTVEAFLRQLEPATSFVPAAACCATTNTWAPASSAPPLLRVLVLDGVYNDAAAMFRHLRKRGCATPHVALHPQTLSVYRRAQHGYAGSVGGSDPAALRICTVEAVALLLEELGEPKATTTALVAAIEANNAALANTPGSGPVAVPVGRRARARRRREEAEAARAAAAPLDVAAEAKGLTPPAPAAARAVAAAACAVVVFGVVAAATLRMRPARAT